LSYRLDAYTREDNARTDLNFDPNSARLFPGGIRSTNNYFSEARVNLQQHLLKDFWIDAEREQILLRRRDLQISKQGLRFQVMKTILAVELSYDDVVLARFDYDMLDRADNFPPLNAEPSTEQHPGKFEWADLFADHAEKEAAFYSKLFDWIPTKIEQNHHLVMLMSIGTQPVASIVQRPLFKRGAGPARWVGYAAVADVFAALASVEKAKGKVLAKLRDVPERGEQAIVSDRDGLAGRAVPVDGRPHKAGSNFGTSQ